MELVKNILKFYLEVETDNPIKYYTNTEFDSNVTDFEALSNGNRLVLKSNLDARSSELVVRIFQAVYDKNYVYFTESSGHNFYIDDDSPQPFSYLDYQQMDLFNPNNYRQFILAYMYYNKDDNVEPGADSYNEDGRIGNVAIYNTLPEVNHNFDRKCGNKRQKVYEVKDILDIIMD